MRTVFRLTTDESGLRLLALIVYYFTEATDKVNYEEMKRVLTQQGPTGEQIMRTIAVELEEKGRLEGQKETILQLLTVRFGELPAEFVARVRGIEDTAVLDDLVRQTATAVALDDIHLPS